MASLWSLLIRNPHVLFFWIPRYTLAMSKETFVFVVGVTVFFNPFLGLPREYKEWILILCGLLLMIVGYRLRHSVFLRSIEHSDGERRGDAFVESSHTAGNRLPTHKDSEQIL